MDENRLGCFEEVVSRCQKIEVVLRKVANLAAVRTEGFVSAVAQPALRPLAPVDGVEHHLFVVAHQEYEVALVLQFDQHFDTAFRTGTAIDDVSQHDDGVFERWLQMIEQNFERNVTSVDAVVMVMMVVMMIVGHAANFTRLRFGDKNKFTPRNPCWRGAFGVYGAVRGTLCLRICRKRALHDLRNRFGRHESGLSHIAAKMGFQTSQPVAQHGQWKFRQICRLWPAVCEERNSNMNRIAATIAFGAILLCVCGNLTAAGPRSSDAVLLKSYGIEPTAESLRKYLDSFRPDSDITKRQQALVPLLGDRSFVRRESATRELIRLSVGSTDVLKQAARHADAEIRWRAQRILENADSRGNAILQAVFQTIDRQHLTGLTKEILDTLPHCKGRQLIRNATAALKSTTTSADVDLLRRKTRAARQASRIAAIEVLEHLQGAAADDDLLRLTDDDDDRIQVAAARALANHGHRDSLQVLVKLLGSSDLKTRLVSVKTLRAFTGQSFAFTPYESPMIREAARGKWQKWIESNAATAAVNFPLKDVRIERGRTLFCDYSRHRLVEIDLAGKIVWEIKVGNHPWGAQGLSNGHRLVANYSARSVSEYDAAGKLVWSHSGLPGGPTSVRRLPNGNTLMACTDSQMVIEVNRRGKTVLSLRIDGRPTDAQRLEDGRTLIVLQNQRRVVEVDREGKVLWKITGLASPFSARRLENGNTLVSCISDGTVREFNKKGEEVWSKTGFRNPNDVQRLSNGNTLVSDRTGLTEVDKMGTVVKKHAFSNVSKFFRY
eukprot:g8237.t1